ncbi:MULTISPECIES: hypothetical protein [Pseudothermotoga]|nr:MULTISPECIES: hypothetical protein [Pseudothermotoga]
MKLHELFRILASQIKLEILSLLLENSVFVKYVQSSGHLSQIFLST